MAEVFGFNKQDADNLLRVIGGNASELPLLSSNEGIIGIFGFELTSTFSGGQVAGYWTASCIVKDALFRTTLANGFVFDPLGAFVALPVGHRGLCLRWARFLFAIQAACPQT